MFDLRVGGVFAGGFDEGFVGFEVFDGFFGVVFFLGEDFADLDFAAAFVEVLHFFVVFARFGVADGLGADDVGDEGLVEQFVLVVFPLLFEAGFFCPRLLLRSFAGVFDGGFVFFALVEFEAAGFLDDDGAGYDVAQEFGADFGAVGNLRILRAQGFDVAVDFAAVEFCCR